MSCSSVIERPFVYCSDILGFVREVAKLRDLNECDLVIQIGIDTGKDHLKMILTKRLAGQPGGGGQGNQRFMDAGLHRV